MARSLGVANDNAQGVLFAGASDMVRDMAKALQEEDIPTMMVDTNYRNVTEARMAGISATCDSIVPNSFWKRWTWGALGDWWH